MIESGLIREYHITSRVYNGLKIWDVIISYGLLDTKTIPAFTSLKSAREYCKNDAMTDIVRPIIIVQ